MKTYVPKLYQITSNIALFGFHDDKPSIVDGRICGDISVARSFGDIRFKTRKNEMLVKGVKEGRWSEKFASRIQFKGDLVISLPDVSLVELGPDVEFVLLATDGLWDYMKSSEAVAFVRDQLRQHGDVQLACDALGQKVLDQRSQDNISIVIADLGYLGNRVKPGQKVVPEIIVSSMYLKRDFILESSPPGMFSWDLLIKDEAIPLFPDMPRCHDENFHEEGLVEFFFSVLDHLEEFQGCLPVDVQDAPASNTELTLKEEVECCFLNIGLT
ncbi:hypothetical protein EJB05_40370, partial [Eragrostis curvula]